MKDGGGDGRGNMQREKSTGPEIDELWTWREEGPGPAAWVGDGRQRLRYRPRKQERKQVWQGWWGVKIQHTVPPNRDTPQTF